MKAYVYKGCFNIIKKSGIGQAIVHQEKMLDSLGEEYNSSSFKNADIVHLNTVLPDSVLVAIIAKMRGKKVIYYGHSTMEDFKNSFRGSNQLAPLFKKWIKFCYMKGDAVITPTEYSKEILESYGIPRKIYALSNGIDTEMFSPSKEGRSRFRSRYNIGKNEKAIISIGHFIERKGILDFVRMAENMPDKRFLWFGYTDMKLIPSNIKEAIENAPSNLQFPGFINQEELRDAYCGADVFAFMSFEETEGIVVLEALACKSPAVVRDIGVYSGWLRDKENVYMGRSLQEFEAIVRGLCSGELPSLSDAGRAFAESRSIKEMGKQLREIHRDLKCPSNAKSKFPPISGKMLNPQ